MALNGIKVLIEAVDRVTAPARRIGAAVNRISASLGLRQLGDQLGKVVSGMGRVAQAAGAMALKISAAGALSAAGLWAIFKRTSDAGDAAAKAAQRIGISVRGYQELGYAAGLAGSNAEELGDAMTELNGKIADAAGGNKELREAFRKMGVQIRDANGQIRPTEAIFADIAAAFARVPDGAQKSAAAMALFGEAGVNLIPLLNGGADGLREAAEEARRLGLIVDDETAEAMVLFNKNLATLMGSITGVYNAISAKLLPIINPLVKRVTDWIVANRALIATRVQAFVEALPARITAVRKAFDRVYERMKPVISAIADIVERTGPLNAVLGVTAGIVGGQLIVAIAGLVGAFAQLAPIVGSVTVALGKLAFAPIAAAAGTFVTAMQAGVGVMGAFNAVLLANPIDLVIAAVAALAGAAYLIWKHWEPIKKFFSDTWGDVQQSFQKFSNWVENGFSKQLERAMDAVWELVRPIIEMITSAIDGVMSAAGAVADLGGKVTGGVSQAVDAVGSGASSALDWAMRQVGFGGGDTPAPAGAPAVQGPFANGAPGQRADVGGRVDIVVTQEGRPRITNVQSNDSRITYEGEVDAGHFMAAL
jgi:hypothetical protein